MFLAKTPVVPVAPVALAVLAAAVLAVGCSRTPGPGLARGTQIYDTCVPCHGPRGLGNPTIGAPEIAGLPKWYLVAQLGKFKGGLRGTHPDDAEGARMRPMARSLYRPGDLESVAQYVETLRPARPAASLAGGNVAAGQARFNAVCIACHGAAAAGNQALGAPPLNRQADWYMFSQLSKFRSGLRGAHPQDATGMQMAAMAKSLPDTTAMKDVIAYIRTLQP
ncbi:MAG: c-type cytochrome [Candidatus Eisenbacteria bacterium]|nr:c-type cytochrome [Candidatus Eisenbacteria bacterium]